MLRTNHCGELRLIHVQQTVSLCGWAHRVRNLGAMVFIDLRDRFGVTQLVFSQETNAELYEQAKKIGREYVLQITGKVAERSSKNQQLLTGEIEILVTKLVILNTAKTPPFTIEDQTDGGEELRMKYRYLDIRRKPIQENLLLRHQVMQATRNYLSQANFVEIETPCLIKSTPEGARDFLVPSRVNKGEFYALPQSPQTFKQLLMVAGMDRYFQIARCFRDEDLRADRQPEFTQIDCELSFVEQEDVLQLFEKFIIQLFEQVKQIKLPPFQRMTYDQAMSLYGSDKPDLRFGMSFVDITKEMKAKPFKLIDQAELVLAIKIDKFAHLSRKQLDEYIDWMKQFKGISPLFFIKYNADKSIKSSIDQYYTTQDLQIILEKTTAQTEDLIFILAGEKLQTQKALGELRLMIAEKNGLKDKNQFVPLWVIDFPLLEWNQENNRFYAMHHPFTAPKLEDLNLLASSPQKVRANAYDMVINGVELGGGSVRITQKELQNQMFSLLGFSEKEAVSQFGFLMNAFEYGAPPHAGIALGLDRLCAMLGKVDSIREFIAFPKNNSGRDVMIDAPSVVDEKQLRELEIKLQS